MTRRSYYTLALWLPVAWPIIISFGEVFLHAFTWHQMSKLSGLIILSGMFGGIQYVLFAALVSFRASRVDSRYLTRIVWLFPLVFAPICSAGLWLCFKLISIQASQMQVRTVESVPIDLPAVVMNIALFTLVIGYCYVAILNAVLWVLDRFGFIED